MDHERRRREEPSKTPHLHVRTVEGLLFGDAIVITGNARALVQLRRQIDRALGNEDPYPFEKAVYQDVHGEPFEVAVKRARSKEERWEPGPKPEKTAEELPWTERARRAEEEGQRGKRQ